MMNFFQNSDFVDYLHALIDMHALMVTGQSYSTEAESLRDVTDKLWLQFSLDEQTELGRISELLYGVKSHGQVG